MAKKPKAVDAMAAMVEPPAAAVPSRYAHVEQDDDLPLVNLDTLDEHGLTIYGIRNLNIDMAGQTAAQMRETLRNQIGHHRAGGR